MEKIINLSEEFSYSQLLELGRDLNFLISLSEIPQDACEVLHYFNWLLSRQTVVLFDENQNPQ